MYQLEIVEIVEKKKCHRIINNNLFRIQLNMLIDCYECDAGVDSGIGAGVDSFYEYLVKGSIMLNRPELMEIFKEAKVAIDKYLSKNDWHIWASMTKGLVTIPVFQSLDAYWPGMLSMVGDIPNAMKSIYNYHSVWKQYGFLPEFYNSKC